MQGHQSLELLSLEPQFSQTVILPKLQDKVLQEFESQLTTARGAARCKVTRTCRQAATATIQKREMKNVLRKTFTDSLHHQTIVIVSFFLNVPQITSDLTTKLLFCDRLQGGAVCLWLGLGHSLRCGLLHW